jgi:hypothetical protein
LAFDRVVDLYSDDYGPESGKLRVGLNASGYYSPAKDHSGLADKIGKISAGGERPALSCIKACRDEQQQQGIQRHCPGRTPDDHSWLRGG